MRFSNTEYNHSVIQPSPRSISRTFSSFLTDTPYPLNNNFPDPAPQPLAMTILLSVSVNLTMFNCFNLSNQGIEWMILSGLTIITFRVSVSCVWKWWSFVYALVTPDPCPGTCWWGVGTQSLLRVTPGSLRVHPNPLPILDSKFALQIWIKSWVSGPIVLCCCCFCVGPRPAWMLLCIAARWKTCSVGALGFDLSSTFIRL